MTRRSKWLVALAAAAVLVVVGVIVATTGFGRYEGKINSLEIDLSRPDGYLSTPAVSKLPRDLVKAPVLRDLIDEDFAFYYEEHEDRLGLRGALKRIAFEHDKTLADNLLESALDEPAEMAFWADAKGAPRYWLMALTRNALARTIQEVGSVAMKDKQLTVIESVSIGSSEVTAYALKLSPRRTLALLSLGNRVVVLSDPGLLFDAERHADPRSRDVVAGLLSGDAKVQSSIRQGIGLGEAGTGHTIVADMRLLSFGYQQFFPGMKALRVDVEAGGGAVRTSLRVAGGNALPAAAASRELWAALPAGAAACAVLPAEWAELKRLMTAAKGAPEVEAERKRWNAFADRLDGPAAICWYSRSQLHTPLVVARLKAGAEADADVAAVLEAVSGWLVPGGGNASAAASASASDAAAASAPALAAPSARTPRPAGAAASGAATRWSQDITAPWGPIGEGDETSYRPTIALQGRWITFSPDEALASRAVDTQARRYPGMAETMPANGSAPVPLLTVAPKQVAELMQRESFAVIGADQELFRQAAERRLVPRFAALAKLPVVRVAPAANADAQGWVALDWQPVQAAAAPVAPSASAPASAVSANRRGRS